ncbi:ATP synthase F0 subcomplex A subunit [Pseudaminobacter salicylatoxidans]|uniref:ATP synthase subunit a n=1 Tax=Pseudaminobacter salicylatoxidans TaxID=93369 RepID=A0A316BZP0_PSESE|nr:F0F1 ATP synthase subunit A [Pseudaminobacter salicylatoxidans]PWJ80546.1 ATP synthase F0 subcomplex A subunit [Pseudaminobacter salicylatoxidans]
MAGPIEQFEISRIVPVEIGGFDLSFTNSSAYMVLTVALASGFLLLATKRRAIVPGRLQSCAELLFELIAKTLRDNTGEEGMRFFPLVFSLFMFVLVANLIGMFPYAFTVTSHIAITFTLAMLVFLTVTIYGLMRNGLGFLRLFMPPGVPLALAPILVPIEVVSYISRPVSHSVRLFAVMLAGHITLKVFAGFVVSLGGLGALGIAGAILPLAMTVGLTGLELLMSVIQAYIFTMLTCMYLNDALHPGH